MTRRSATAEVLQSFLGALEKKGLLLPGSARR